MNSLISRRTLFISSDASLAGLAAVALSPGAAQAASAHLRVERRTIEVNGRAAAMFGIRQPDGTPRIVLDPGQQFFVTVENRAAEATTIHWHGQTPFSLQDGVSETGGLLIQPGAVQAYDFPTRPDTHCMHSHHGLQEQPLMAAPLIAHTAADLKEDLQDVTILRTGGDAGGGDGRRQGGPGEASMPGMAKAPASGVPDLNDYDYDAYLANDRTLADPLVIRAASGVGSGSGSSMAPPLQPSGSKPGRWTAQSWSRRTATQCAR